mmetsp:Transcript_63535/g.148157  ORF Transcript_63535/g.148157 Transcript_63535/m.148157 type:complete len:826 (+) Transcript_63535:60-2537(+)
MATTSWTVLVWLALAHAEPCSRSDAACLGDDPTELIQRVAHGKSADIHVDEETGFQADQDQELVKFKEEAAKVVAEMASLHAESREPLMNFVESEEMKQLQRDIELNRMSVPIRPTGSAMDIDIAKLQADVRKGMQNMVRLPTPEETLPMLVEALGVNDGNFTVPRGIYLRMAEGVALAKHHANQNTELQDLVVSIVPALAQMAQDMSLFEPLAAANELAAKGMLFPKSKHGTPGGRDLVSRMPELARQNIRAMKLLQPALDHALNTSTPSDYCSSEEVTRLEGWLDEFGDEEGTRKLCDQVKVDDQKTVNGKMCFTFDPDFGLGSYALLVLAPEYNNSMKEEDLAANRNIIEPAGWGLELALGLTGSISGSSFRKWKKLTYEMAKIDKVSVQKKAVQNSLMFTALGIDLIWRGKYKNGKDMALLTELGFQFKQPQNKRSPLTYFAVQMHYHDLNHKHRNGPGQERSVSVVKNTRTAQGGEFNYASWGSTLNTRVMGDTAVTLYSVDPLSGEAQHYGTVEPRFGVKLGDFKWSSVWPMRLASNWGWGSKWSISPKREWKGLRTHLTLPFLTDCVAQHQVKNLRPSILKDEEKALKWQKDKIDWWVKKAEDSSRAEDGKAKKDDDTTNAAIEEAKELAEKLNNRKDVIDGLLGKDLQEQVDKLEVWRRMTLKKERAALVDKVEVYKKALETKQQEVDEELEGEEEVAAKVIATIEEVLDGQQEQPKKGLEDKIKYLSEKLSEAQKKHKRQWEKRLKAMELVQEETNLGVPLSAALTRSRSTAEEYQKLIGELKGKVKSAEGKNELKEELKKVKKDLEDVEKLQDMR